MINLLNGQLINQERFSSDMTTPGLNDGEKENKGHLMRVHKKKLKQACQNVKFRLL